jgi:TetR/AcrR family transcriptional regulator, mexCD-oprJ operon repressor
MSPNQPVRQPLQQRVAAAILDGAAHVFVLQGDGANMNDVAAAAGVARATVYRYFPNRETLLDELAQSALHDVEERLTTARIDAVPAEDSIRRAVGALLDAGDPFVVLVRRHQATERDRFERAVTRPLRELFERGQADGDVRADISSARLTESLLWLIVGVFTSAPSLGREDMTAMITGLFLDGARARGPRPA